LSSVIFEVGAIASPEGRNPTFRAFEAIRGSRARSAKPMRHWSRSLTLDGLYSLSTAAIAGEGPIVGAEKRKCTR
jgi:hypothetical protein